VRKEKPKNNKPIRVITENFNIKPESTMEAIKKTQAKKAGAVKKKDRTKSPKSTTETGKLVSGTEVENKAIFNFYGLTNANGVSLTKLYNYVKLFAKNVKLGKISKDSPNYELLKSFSNISTKAYNVALKAKKQDNIKLKVSPKTMSKLEKIITLVINEGLAGLDEYDDEEDLEGLGCAGDSSCICGSQKKSLGAISASDITNESIGERVALKERWKPIFGSPTRGFKALVYGTAGSGKTTMLLDFCKDFVSDGKYALYVTGEQAKEHEGKLIIADTFKERLISRGANVQGLDILARVPRDLSKYNILILDSVQALDMTPEDIEAIANKYPHLSIIVVSQINKKGNYKGSTEWAHNPDIILTLPKYGMVEAQKNRFGLSGTLKFK
jgi:primosomal protein N'